MSMDDDDSPFDDDAPPIGPGVKIWVNPGGGPSMSGNSPAGGAVAAGAITEEERARFGIREVAASTSPTAPKLEIPGPSAPTGVDPRIIEALVKKFPDFVPSWPEKTQKAWFAAFDQLIKAGLK